VREAWLCSPFASAPPAATSVGIAPTSRRGALGSLSPHIDLLIYRRTRPHYCRRRQRAHPSPLPSRLSQRAPAGASLPRTSHQTSAPAPRVAQTPAAMSRPAEVRALLQQYLRLSEKFPNYNVRE
jgi:hypothetical protein